MIAIERVIARIGRIDDVAARAARERLDALTKPQGSLGRLEELAIQLSAIVGHTTPHTARRAVIVMAADHGVTARGVSAYPREVTGQMVANFVAGGAAINVLARRAGARVVVVDVGVDAPAIPGVLTHKVARGTRDMTEGPALQRHEAERAVAVGIDVFEKEHEQGLDVVATGDMGIGNTTAASAITAVMTGAAASSVVGRGTGIDDATLARKIEIVEHAIALNRPEPWDPLDVLAKVGGLEIAGLVGVILAACAHRVPVLLDGFISGAAALIAARMHPSVTAYLIAAHRSVEPGHEASLRALGLRPLLELELRLGEGTGAVLAIPLLDAAAGVLTDMATFDSARVSRR
ncbi:MAG: nicotinate-nucleotide--dimethylbenzimidazole phosphoribosyltransferase [Chloroflexi bacterium]|nr:nicotinate-nucleotide--dimethylbenzimidazole phosphoribosyltransferase [Chloroflexota bacterium]